MHKNSIKPNGHGTSSVFSSGLQVRKWYVQPLRTPTVLTHSGIKSVRPIFFSASISRRGTPATKRGSCSSPPRRGVHEPSWSTSPPSMSWNVGSRSEGQYSVVKSCREEDEGPEAHEDYIAPHRPDRARGQ